MDVIVDDTSWYTLPFHSKELATFILDSVLSTLQLKKTGLPLEISLLLANNSRLQQLNLDFRQSDKPTNVLSFPYCPVDITSLKELFSCNKAAYLGDIAISYETIAEEAAEQDKSFKNHFTHMVAHGLLHLLGYDHIKEQDRAVMESIEIEILSNLNISNPYN